MDVKIVDALTTRRPVENKQTRVQITIDKNVLNEEKCGENFEFSKPLVVHGLPTKSGEYPWLVALLQIGEKGGYDFRCAGSLVSKNHVITGEH